MIPLSLHLLPSAFARWRSALIEKTMPSHTKAKPKEGPQSFAELRSLATLPMKQVWTQDELVEQWTLAPGELVLLINKSGAGRVGFAALLKFFQGEGCDLQSYLAGFLQR